MISKYTDLQVWQKARILVKDIYELTKLFPRYEQFGLADQMRRAAISIPSNIAEGFGRNSSKEFRQFLNIARGSCAELQTQVTLAKDLVYIDDKTFESNDAAIVEIYKMLNALIKRMTK
jgi:four helix bundle protein